MTEAQGVCEAAITRAEGKKQSAILQAEGQAEAIERVAEAGATKIFLPTEMQGLFGMVGGLAEVLRGDAGDGGGGADEESAGR